MKQLGLKKLLLLSVMLLVGLSVSVSSYVLYLQQKDAMMAGIIGKSQGDVDARAKSVQTLISEKIKGIEKLAVQYRTQGFAGSDADMVGQARFLANAMNLKSGVVALENGNGYWTLGMELAPDVWPGNKMAGDVRTLNWYQPARQAPGVYITEPYIYEATGTDTYWITIAQKIADGVLAVNMRLGFLDAIVQESNDTEGAVAFILSDDSTVLASTSSYVKAGKKAVELADFGPVARQAISQESNQLNYTLGGEDKILFSRRITIGDKDWYYCMGLSEDIAFSELASARTKAISISILATVISVLIAFVLIRTLYRPILSLKETIAGLSAGNGDLTQRLAVESNDDLGQISQGVNQFIESLQLMMIDIQKACTSLQTNIRGMRNQSEENSRILQHHALETDQVVTAIEEMNSTADSMAKDAANTAALTERANKTSTESHAKVDYSQNTVSALISDVDKAVIDVQKMSDETQTISGILAVIGEIAEQTNLLALNAAIEAARAGEQGRGFAVVADEVRNLASRTKSSTEEIERALGTLLAGTQGVVSSMGNTKQRCEETAESSSEVAASLEVMADYVGNINDLSAQIATAAEEQSAVTQELSRNMMAIADIVSQLDTNGQKALNDAEDIQRVNDQLVAIVGRFKV